MGQVTNTTLEFATKHIAQYGTMPPLTVHEVNQMAILAYRALNQPEPMQPSKTIETQYGPHDLSKIQDWGFLDWGSIDSRIGTPTYFGFHAEACLDLKTIHENPVVINLTTMTLVKNRTGLSKDEIVAVFKTQVEYMVLRQLGDKFVRILDSIKAWEKQ